MIFKLVPSLFFYFLAIILTLLAFVFDLQEMYFICKPVIVPAIYFYYLQIVNSKPKFWFSMGILSSFISDMLAMFHLPNQDLIIALLNLFVYFVFTYYFISFFVEVVHKELKLLNVFIISFLLFLLAYFFITLMNDIDKVRFYLYIIYGLTMSLMTSIAIYNYSKVSSSNTFFGILFCICSIITDSFFVLYNYFLKIDILVFVNLVAQFVSYYFMVNYITTKENRNALYDRYKGYRLY